MRDDALTRLCLIFSILGLVGLFVIINFTSPLTIGIGEINEEMIGSIISTRGTVKSVRFHEEGHVFLTLSDGKSKIKAVIFSSTARKIDVEKLKRGVNVSVTGRVSEYKGGLEIIVESLKYT